MTQLRSNYTDAGTERSTLSSLQSQLDFRSAGTERKISLNRVTVSADLVERDPRGSCPMIPLVGGAFPAWSRH